MEEEYSDHIINSHYKVRIIIPDDETRKLIANELEKKMSSPIVVKGIIAANVSNNQDGLGVLWYNMTMLKLDYFGNKAFNTGVYTSFKDIPSAETLARKSYTEGTGNSRFDMIVYEKKAI